ncbi:MAG: autotransporter-associated beta strand repeat-containing protein [Akkermansia sp.]|nr:autotransporter-associated beta strand repeat-containing protein [Akkermansia sp.]
MKLHLPKTLRGALLACFASVAGLTTTVATGAFAGGVFYVSLSQVAQAADVAVTTDTTDKIWTNAVAETHAGDTVTVGDATAEDAITLQVGEGGTNAFDSIDEEYRSMDFGTVTVNAGDTLKLWTWTGTNKALGSTNKVAIESAITLNQAQLRIEDGSYYFAGAITITGTSSIRTQYAKGISLAHIEGDENAVLELVRGNGTHEQKDDSRAVFELTEANEKFSGTVKLVDDNGTPNVGAKDGLQLVLSNTNALVNAVLDFGETEDVTLALNASKVMLKAIKGHGFVEYYNSTSTVGEIELTDAAGTFSGTSAANVNWTISGGNQGLSNASILGTYTVGKGASSIFEGAITLGSLVNNSTTATGIDVTNMTSLTINNQQAYQGATITGLGTLTGLSDGNTFSYGNGWLATYDSASGTATLSEAAVYWSDAGADDNINWNEATNWSSSAVPAATDAVRLTADNAGKTIALTSNTTVQELRVYGAYTLSVGAGASYSLTATDGIHLMSETAGLSKSGAGTLTLTTNVTANALGSSAGNLVVNTLNVYTGDTFTKTGDGLMTLTNADGLLGKNITVDAGELHITQTGDIQVTNGSTTTVTVNSGATLDDDRRLRVTGGSLSVTGGGIYELGGICLSGFGATATILNVNADTVLHITGTTQSADGDKGSFMLSNWPAGNVINIHGLLVSDAGISDRDGSGTLHVEDGGVLQLNAGMSRTNHGNKDTTINIKEGASLVVNGDSTTHTDYITTNLAAGATVFTTGGATILNAMRYNGAVKLGAAADTILTLTADAPNVGTITILGSGDTVKTFTNDTVSQTAAGGTVKYTNAVSGTAITLNEGAKFEAAAGLNLSGALTLAANAEAKLGGAVTLGSVDNSGTIDVSELQSLRLGADTGSMGATVNIGTVAYTAGSTFTYGNGWTATWQDDGTALITGDAAIAWADTGAEGDTDINWTTAGNWSGGAAPTATDYVQLAATEGVTRTLVLTADTTVAGMRVYDAYTLSVGEGVTAAFTATNGVELNGETAKLSKAGTGTLSMSSAQAIATKMTVTEGTLKLTDRLAGDAESNDSAGAITYEADLTALTVGADGVLSILAAEKNNNKRTTVKLANFNGILEITGGFVDTDSTFSNATIKVNGGGLLSRVPAGDISNAIIIGDSGAAFYSLGSTGVDNTWKTKFTGALSGAGTLTIQERGDWYFAGDMSGFTGGIVLNSSYDHVYFQTSATVQSFSASSRVGNDAAVHFGDGTNTTLFTIKDAMTVGAATTFELKANATVKNENQVSVSDNITFVLKGAGKYDMDGWLNMGSGAKVELKDTVTLNLADTTQTVSSGEIALAAGATVNDSRALTIDGAYTISGAGTYKQLGSLALTTNGALTLSGVVSIASLAGHNAGTITLADTLTSLRLDDFVIGTNYVIGNVADGGAKDWNTLLGYDAKQYSIAYADGVLASEYLGDIVWASPADEDIAWGGTDNWQVAENAVSVAANDAVILPTPMDGLSSTIAITADTTVAKVTVQDAYAFSVAEGASYSFDAGSIVLEQGGSLGKVGAGTLSMSLADAVAAQMTVTAGTLRISDTISGDDTNVGDTNAALDVVSYDTVMTALSGSGTLAVTLSGGKDSNVRSTLKLADAFTGTLEVQGGNLDRLSDLGGTTLVRLNNGGLYSREPLAGNHQFTQAIEVQGTSWLRHQGGNGKDTTYYTELTGAISGSGTLQVYEVGDWYFSGNMSQFTGGIDVVEQANVYIKSDATALTSLKAAGGSLLNVSNNATLTTAATSTTGSSGTASLETESGSSLNLGAVTIANGTTLALSGAGTMSLTTLSMGNNATLQLAAGAAATITTATEAQTYNNHPNSRTGVRELKGTDFVISVGQGATLQDKGAWELSNGADMTVSGGGVYEVAALALGAYCNTSPLSSSSITVETGTTLHITGTNTSGSKFGDAFSLGHWDPDNTVTVKGLLALESGLTTFGTNSGYKGIATINVADGGKIAFNNGFYANVSNNASYANNSAYNPTQANLTTPLANNSHVILNVAGGAVLEVSGQKTDGANGVVVNIANEAIVMGGNANDTTESKLANNLVFARGAYVGAKAGTTFTLAPESGSMSLEWLDIIGTADTEGQAQGSGGKVVFDSAVTVAFAVKVLEGASAEFKKGLTNQDNMYGGLTNAGLLTLGGVVQVTSLSNSGSIDLAAATSLALGDFSMTEGATYNVGTLTGLSDTHTIGSLLGAGVGHTVTYDGKSIISVDSHLVWDAQAATEGDNVWNATNTNWQYDAAESTFKTDQKVIFAALDGVNTTVELGENVTADSILLTGAYNFSVAEGSSYSLATTQGIAKEGNGSFTKVGSGTLIMSNADALAAGVHITGGALQLSDTQGNTVNSDSILQGASNTSAWQESGLLVDLSGISAGADGTLQLTLAGQTWPGNDSTRLQLAESFAGKVEVLGGQLGHASSLGGATQVILNGGGIVFNNDGDEANNNSTVFATPVHVASGSTGALRAWGSYSNLAAAVSSLTGDETATLQKYDEGVIRLDELSGFAGQVEIHQGKLILNDTTGSATLSSLTMAAGTALVLEAGQKLTVKNLVEGAYIDLNGASSLTINAVNSNGVLDFEGDAAAGASFAVAQGDTYTLAHDGLTLGTLTNAGAGTLKLQGAVSLGDLYNASGILDLSDVTALSISNMQYAIGAEYHVGQFTGVGTDAFLALIGNGGNSFLSASYDDATGMVSFNASTYWKDDGADGNNVWADASNWSTGDLEGFSLANTTVKLGDEAAGRNILLQSNVEATTTVHVAEAYTFSVAADESYAFNGTLQYAGDHVQALTKAGEGTLTVNLAQATANGGMHIEEGRLVVLGDQVDGNYGKTVNGGFTYNGPHDLSAISAGANGILSVKLYGNMANTSFDSSALTLADDFTGTLEVTHGYLMMHYNDTMKTTLGGTSKIRLDGGGVALYQNDVVSLPVEVGANGAWLMGRSTGNVYDGTVTGAGNLTLVTATQGTDDLTFSGSINLGDYISGQDENGDDIIAKSNLVKRGGATAYISGADNNINISGGVIAEAGQLVFQNQQTLHSLTVNGSSTVTLEKNATIGSLTVNGSSTVTLEKNATIGSLTLNTGTLVIGTDDAAAEVSFTDTAARTGNNNTTRKVTLKSGSAVTDAAYWQLTGGSLTLEGAGTYTTAGIGLSANAANATTLNVEQGVHLHVTGTANDAGKNTGAFSLAHWDSQNTVNVRGVLELESGISTYSGYISAATINVESGGKLAFNNGLTAAGKDNAVTINVAGGATLQVSGTDTSGTNLVYVNVAREARIMGGAEDATLANDLVIDQGFYVGAAAGNTLTLAPESGTLDADCTWIDVLGTADDAGGTVVFDVDSLRLNALNVHAGGKAVITSAADLHDGNGYGAVIANGTLSFDGAGTITLNEAIQLGGTGTVEFRNTDSTKLVLSDSLLTENNPGLSMTWTLINVAEGGTLTGWDKATLDYHHFLLNGEELSLGDWDGYTLDNGKLTLHMLVRYWDATAAGAVWNTTDANWRPTASSTDTNLFETNSRVIFTDTDDAGNALQNAVAVADDGVHAKSIVINGSGYSFSRGAVLVDQSIAATQNATFDSSLVIGSSTQELQMDVSEGATLSVGALETLSEVKNGVSVYLQTGGSFRKTGAGTLSITGDVQGIVNSAVVEGGILQLADAASLSVGSNSITGGSLQNVGLYAAGSVKDGTSTSGQAVNATNVISSADGENMGVLTAVNLNAGSASAYASIQNVVFAGTSTLSGYITFEKTKHQRQMAVATGGSLKVENLTFDLHGLSAGTKVLIENTAVGDAAEAYKGTITDWDSITLTYSGVAVNAASVDKTVAGVVTIMEDGGDLYWDGLSEGVAAANWNTSSANWSATAGTDGSSVYYALSDTYFGATPQGAAKGINVAQDMVANRIYITEGGYSFAGYRVATLSDMKLSHTSGAVAFNNELVVQGALTAIGGGDLSFGGTTTVVKNAKLNTKSLSVTGNMTVLGDLAITSGSTDAGGAGSFTLGTGVTLSAANISLHVDAGAATDSDFSAIKATMHGNISTAGELSITGTAAKNFNGVVNAGDISVDTGSDNAVTFNTVTADTLTVEEGSTVNLKSGGAISLNSGIGTINLAGTLGFATFAVDYRKYNIITTSENANVTFESITKVYLDSLSGQQIDTDAEGNAIYGSISFADGYRTLSIGSLSTVQNLHVGQAEYGATLNNATGAIHGNLSVAAGAGLTVNSDNIMANGRGTWEIAGPLKLGATTQTLAGNTLLLSGAAISGNANAAGLVYTEDATLRYTAINSISANMNVTAGKTLTISAGMLNMDSLEISGNVSGSGDINLKGNGTVILSGANDYTGAVTVEDLVTLQVANTQALSHATLNLEADGILLADMAALGAPAEVGMLNLVASEPVTLDAETRTAGILQLHALAATDVASAADAAYKVGGMSVSNAQTLDLLLSFGEGESLQTMKTYNLFAADESYSLADIAEALNMELYVAVSSSREHVARNQYKVLYDEATNVISIRTMLGNIWSGGADTDGDGIWSTTNTDKNWSNKDYNESTGFNSAIFVDLEGHDEEEATVTIQGTVTPGDIYFEADKTYYNLTATDGDALLADGTNIHKAGAAMVDLSLANNGTMEHAVGNVDLQAGTITLSKDLAVGGEVIVAQNAHLWGFATAGGKLITAGYTATGDFSGVTLGQDTISGLGDAKGLIASTDICTQVAIVGGADAPVLLENVTLASSGSNDKLTNVAIGENVDVTGYYTLSGHVHFRDTLANTGTVNLDSAMTAEIGKLAYTFTVNDAGASEYVYQLVQGGQINGMSDLTVQDVYINGVNLSTGLADGVATVFTGSDGSLRLSIGNVTATDGNGQVTAVDGSVGMPKWDERWNNGNQPGLSRRYAGTVSSAVVTFAEGITADTDHYYYSSVVNANNANAVNGEQQEIVVTLSAAATGAIAAGGATAGDASMEMWMYDRSGFDTVIAGRYFETLNSTYRQGGDTHLLINTDTRHTNLKTWVVGGSWLAGQDGASYVTVQAGNILNLVGATYGANQEGASTVYIDGGRIYELFAGGFDASKNASYYGDVKSVNLTITGGELGGQTPEGTPDALAGNKSVYGGSYHGTVHGDVNVTVDGTATITNLVGGGYAGTVEGAITLNLMNGTATTVNAAGIGNSTAQGNVTVNLYDAFNATSIYGGKQNGSGATVQGASTLAFVEEGVSYDMTGKTLKGFDTISLADGATVKVSTDSGFATDNETGVLTVSGAGVLNLTGNTDIARDITLIDGATLWFNSDYAGNGIHGEGARRTLTATAGTTIDVTGQPTNDGDGLCVWLDLAGHGVDGKGALCKGLQDAETSPSGKVALPRVTLSDSASVNAEDNIYFIECMNAESDLYLNGHTLTKIGDKDLVLYNSTVKDNTDANAVVDGTIFVKEGTLGVGHGMRAGKTNVVLSEGTSLDILSVSDDGAIIGALSGSGTANLAHELTITTNDIGSYDVESDFMDATEKYNQYSAGAGFNYGVYSGMMTGTGALYVAGDGTQYLSGDASNYTGGTRLYDSATLYLMGSTEGSMTKGSTTASGGVVGTGAIAWESDKATLYLGNGVQVFNNGTTNVANSTMVIGVEAAPKGDKLTNYVGANSKGADGALVYISIDGVEYVEVATHNLSSISCNGIYADGTTYMADTLIDRNKMLLVSKAVWDADTATVSGFSAGGYNTATYSGVLSGNANLTKVGQGTLILDQTNTYTGTTTIEEGTLVLKGWAQIGGSKTSAALDVQQKTGSSLMLAYDGTYGDEITQITNDISINGTGDVRWITEAATGKDTAALISTIGSGVSFALRGDISGDGNVLHAGAGTLVLSGDSTYTGGTHATTGVVEVQSAAGLGSGKVDIDDTADLHATVEAGTTASRLTTAIEAADSSIEGDVVINGTAGTERVLSMNTNGYASASTTLNDSGTLLVNGAAVKAETALLKGTGTLAVSDATGQGATAQADALMDFTGDFVVEGDNAGIAAKQGNFNGGSMSISGQNAKVSLAGSANIAYGEKLELKSTGSTASADDNTAAALSAAGVSVAAGGTLSVSNSATVYSYNLSGLQQVASAAVNEMLGSGTAGSNLAMGANTTTDYTYHFDRDRALNAQTAGMVEGGLTLNSDSRYEEYHANINLAGGALTLNTSGGKITLDLLTNGNVQTFADGGTSQIVLFSGVSSLTLDGTAYGEANAIMMMAAADGEAAVASNNIYSTLASDYFTGWNITNETYLVYDAGARVVYLDKAVPEPTTTTLSLLSLAALVARRRRK